MTHPTDEELDALDAKLASQIGDDVAVIFDHEYLFKQSRIAITALRTQLAEVKTEKEKLGRELNLARYGQPDFSWQVHKEALAEAIARADRAEAALAAQIEADAGIADYYVKMRECQIADEKAKAAHHIDVSQLMRWGAGKVQSEVIATAIRAQPHDRTALDRMLRAEREKALREAADLIHRVADGYDAGGDKAIACGLYLTEGNVRAMVKQEGGE